MSEAVELTVDECLELLPGGVLGRVGLSTPMGPRIVPVNYAMHDDAVVFRTTPYSELGSYGWNTDPAFETDHIDYDRHQGGSVVAVGRANLVDDPAELAEIRSDWDPTPWVDGRRHLYIRLVWRDLTGRRVGADWLRRSMVPVRRAI
jgi:nitroimidazol reductase NimA-like FMN-containing flavoprotein (pyridoxamine 5'-phosphate oxidase superfamily)